MTMVVVTMMRVTVVMMVVRAVANVLAKHPTAVAVDFNTTPAVVITMINFYMRAFWHCVNNTIVRARASA